MLYLVTIMDVKSGWGNQIYNKQTNVLVIFS